MTNYETFKLSELRLDEKNYRTGEVSSQRDAILAIINDQKQKLVNLAKDILMEGGISPGEPIWVTRAENSAYTVIEGNRRVTALKLLETPSLADGTIVEKDFRVLAQQFALKPIRELVACVFPTLESAAPWRRRRHLTTQSGVALEPWKNPAKARANRDHGIKAGRALAVFEYLDDGSESWTEIADALDTKWTTVERVLNAGPMKSLLGLNIDKKSGVIAFENGNEVAGRKLLRAILAAMSNTTFKFEDVESLTDRETFLGRFAGMAVKVAPVSATSPTKPGLKPAAVPSPPVPSPLEAPTSSPLQPPSLLPASPATAGIKSRPRPEPIRKTLAHSSGVLTFHVKGARLNPLYAECRKLAVEGNENAAALLLRVFIELSTEAFLTEKLVQIPSALGKKGANKWDDIGISLAAKVQYALDHLDTTGKDKTFQPIRLALDVQSHSIASINTLHGYFHNRQLTPQGIDLMKAWEIWQPYLSALHGAR